MPYFTDPHGTKFEYASEPELIDFANKVRKAGGGEPIKALFPAKVGDSNACLIANALNFHCTVDAIRENVWVMGIEDGPSEERRRQIIRAIARATECEISWYDSDETDPEGVILPERIGNTAYAFDTAKRGWVLKYREGS